MEIGRRGPLVLLLVAALAAVALLGGAAATRGTSAADCRDVVTCLAATSADATAAGDTRTGGPCLHDASCGGGAALSLGLLLAGVAVVAFALPAPRPPVLRAAPAHGPAAVGGPSRTLERPPR